MWRTGVTLCRIVRTRSVSLLLILAGCGSANEGVLKPVAMPKARTNEGPVLPAGAGSVQGPRPEATPIDDASPLREGLVSFEGMVRPSKGGFDVRGVTLDEALVRKAMAQFIDGDPVDPDWFVGARVRVTSRLVQHSAGPATGPSGDIVQGRAGAWFQATAPITLELRKNAEVIEGALGRSKGLFELQGHLISSQDLDWALVSKGGVRAGVRVRLRGQSRVYVCPPEAQCLTSGSLPLFDVARAELLP